MILFLRSKNIKKITRLQDYAKEKIHKSVGEKLNKFYDFLNQRQNLVEITRDIANDIAFKKSEIMKKLELIFQKDKISVRNL